MFQLTDKLPQRWRPALLGALLGDALGVPHEFKQGHQIPRLADIEMRMPATYRKTYAGVPYGVWSDDGSQMLALLSALNDAQGGYDAQLFGRNLLDWYRRARFQAGGVVFDCGLQTGAALEALEEGRVFTTQGSTCGNGSLMRVLPVAALPDWFSVSQDAALRVAMDQSNVTHPQALARVVCALYVALCWGTPDDGNWREAAERAAERVLALPGLTPEERDWVPAVLAYGNSTLPTGSGYVLNTFWSAIWALERSHSLSEALRYAISLGNDTDTVGCVTGGLAGLAFGLDETCQGWLSEMLTD